MKYVHTNIISKDWKKLSRFYQTVFKCTPDPPERKQSGLWLEMGTGVKEASLEGIHLRLPGYGTSGPTLEIYQYTHILPSEMPTANRQGFGHLAFEVEDIQATIDQVLDNGGKKVGEIAETTVQGVGTIRFIYVSDPEGNIIEIQNWKA